MSTPRALTALVAGFMATGISVDPRLSASTPPPRPHPVKAVVSPLPAPPGVEPLEGPAPPDMTIEVAPDGHGAHRVVVRRPGFLVSLRNEDARSAGRDWTAMRVAMHEGAGGAEGRLVWETTRLDGTGVETTRGVVSLSGRGGALVGSLMSAADPVAAGSYKSPRASCGGQHDGFGGFTVLCRFARGVRVTGAANVTGARALDDAWLVPGASPLVRLDLPRAQGGAQGRVIGLVQGITGVALRVEASFLDGEEARLTFVASERSQPVVSF